MELYGWDMVYGASVDIINKQLTQQAASLITTFHYVHQDSDLGGTVTLNGQFGAWTVLDGQDSLIQIRLPIQQATMQLDGQGLAPLLNGTNYQIGTPFDVSGTSLDLQLALSFRVSSQNPAVHELVFDFVANGDGTGGNGIDVLNLNDPAKKVPGGALASLFETAFKELLAANRDKISFIFASVMMQQSANDFAKPLYCDFYFAKPVGGGTAFFNILALTTKSDGSGLDPKVDPAFIGRSDVNMYLAFSKDILLQHYVLPMLPGAMQAAIQVAASNRMNPSTPGVVNAASFQYDANNHVINGAKIDLFELKSFSITMPSSMTQLDTLSIAVQDDHLLTTMKGEYTNYPALVDYNASYHTPLTYSAASKSFVTQPDPSPVQGITGLGSMLDPSAEIMQDGVKDLVGVFFNSFVTAFNLSMQFQIPVQWSGVGDQFQLVQAGLSGNVYLLGKS